MNTVLALLFWRLDAEIQFYDEVERTGIGSVDPLQLAIQRLKFLGHWNESVHKSLILGLYQPNEEDIAALTRGLELLLDAVEELERMGAFVGIERLRGEGDLDNYLNLIGDSAHALRGIRLATGQAGLLH